MQRALGDPDFLGVTARSFSLHDKIASAGNAQEPPPAPLDDALGVAANAGILSIFKQYEKEREDMEYSNKMLGNLQFSSESDGGFDSPGDTSASTALSSSSASTSMSSRRQRAKTRNPSMLTMQGKPVALQQSTVPFSRERVVMSCLVTKVNRRGKKQQRALVVSDRALYNFKPAPTNYGKKYDDSTWYKKNCQRRIRVDAISSVLESSDEGDFTFVVQVRDQYDYEFETPKRASVVAAIDAAHSAIMGSSVNRVSLSVKQMHAVMTTKPQWRLKVGSKIVSKLTGRKQTRARAVSARVSRIVSGTFTSPFASKDDAPSPTDILTSTWGANSPSDSVDGSQRRPASAGSHSSAGSRRSRRISGKKKRPESMRAGTYTSMQFQENRKSYRKSKSSLGLSSRRRRSTTSSIDSIAENAALEERESADTAEDADESSGPGTGLAARAQRALNRMKRVNEGNVLSPETEKLRLGDVRELWNIFEGHEILKKLRDKHVSSEVTSEGAAARAIAALFSTLTILLRLPIFSTKLLSRKALCSRLATLSLLL